MTGVAGLLRLETAANACEAGNPCEVGPQANDSRRFSARQIRMDMAEMAFEQPVAPHPCNGDEELYPNRIGNFSKCCACEAATCFVQRRNSFLRKGLAA